MKFWSDRSVLNVAPNLHEKLLCFQLLNYILSSTFSPYPIYYKYYYVFPLLIKIFYPLTRSVFLFLFYLLFNCGFLVCFYFN